MEVKDGRGEHKHAGVPVVALALPDFVASDLSIPAQISTTGFNIEATAGLDALAAADTIIIPGYWPPKDRPPDVAAALQAAGSRGARIASICIGAFALAGSGLLDGHEATTHWKHSDELADRFPAVRVAPNRLFVDEGSILTGAGSAAAVDLCLHM